MYRQLILLNLWKLVKTCPGTIVHRHRTYPTPDGIAERPVRRVKEGTSTALVQSRLDEQCCVAAMDCYCCVRNIQDLLADWKILYERRFSEHFTGPIKQYGAKMSLIPELRKTKRGSINLARKCFQAVLREVRHMREGSWKGDILVADAEASQEHHASEVYAKRINAKEVLVV